VDCDYALRYGAANILNYRFEKDKKYSLVLEQGLLLRRPGTLRLVSQHNLYAALSNLVVKCFEYDEALGGQEGLDLIVNNKGRIPVRFQSFELQTIGILFFLLDGGNCGAT
jgi:hypothetical protein